MAGPDRLAPNFEIFAVSPDGVWDPSVPIAASRAGAVGLLNLLYLPESESETVAPRVERLKRLARGRFGVVLHGRMGAVERAALAAIGRADVILLSCEAGAELAEAARLARDSAARVGLIATCEAEARLAERLGLDFVAAKGNESGGRVGEETAFVLLQRLLARVGLPVYAWGGIGPAAASACRVAGASGIVLDWQLALAKESAIPSPLRRRLARMDGSESVIVNRPDGRGFRLFSQAAMPGVDRLRAMADEAAFEPALWDRVIAALLAEPRPEDRLWAVGQDGAIATQWSAGTWSVARILGVFRRRLDDDAVIAEGGDIFRSGSPLARSHGTRYPLLQGPMTRVSDEPAFCEAVAEAGGLPFLALALLRGEQSRKLLRETQARMGSRPWGVGILGFVERDLREEQVAEIEAVRPPFAIIAGGRPDQAASLEAKGIATYLHVPSPGMLETFLREGARRFIFEGRECGGHVGPRSSFVLWESMIRVLTDAGLSADEAARVHVVFAGGIHDGLSAAMVGAMARPLARLGMKVGFLMGTAYLFTEEAVASGAILPGFQEVALGCDRTVLVESGPGHAIRCADTAFVHEFEGHKRRLRRERRPAEQVREELEALNMGRLRIASKGIARVADPGPGKSPYARLGDAEQRRDGMYMIGQAAALRRSRCTIQQLHDEVCDGAAARLDALRERPGVQIEAVEPAPSPFDVAIVGLSCLLPGASDADALWHNILAKRDLIGEVPAHRFDADRYYDPDRKARDKVYSKWGGFLDDIPFDPLKYGIPPASLRSIEPGQLLALELVDRVLRDAGYADENPHKERTSVIFGVSGGIADLGEKYIMRALLPQFIEDPDASIWEQLPEWTEDSFAGLLANIVAGRVSNRFDLGGMNFTVDAACASSLAAVMLACRTLADRTSDLVVTGGCDTVQNQFAYLCFAKSGALSPRGRSRALDASADGIAISEGLAAVALKRLEDAERDGDRIYAVIRAVAGGSDGRSQGMTAPRMEGQVRTLRRAYAQAGFDVSTVGLIEAHGTGTAKGDATECQALTTLLNEQGAAPQSVAVGSIKSMIGHTKSAAGICGVVKAALALHHRVLPPTLHVEAPNPKAGLIGGPLYVNSEARPWLRNGHPRRAGVSSFGFGGTNFHAVLEEYEGHASSERKQTARRQWPAELFVLAGKTPDELGARARGLAADLRKAIGAGHRPELADLAYTLHRRPAPPDAPHRVAIVSTDLDALLGQLDAVAGSKADATSSALPAGIYRVAKLLGKETPPAFFFPGQGAQFPDMLRDLTIEFPEVAECFEHADEALAGRTDQRLARLIFPPPAFGDAERARATEALTDTVAAQPALGACGVALRRLLAAFGVTPGLVGGHSYGELAALNAAGVLDDASLYRLSRARGEAMRATADGGTGADLGGMLAVQADRATLDQLVGGLGEVWAANHNSPRQIAISGTRTGLARAVKAFEAAGVASTPLAVACAFHSPIMAPARERFTRALAETAMNPPRLPVFSNVTAREHPADPQAIRSLLADQVVREVRFVDQVEAMYAAGARVFIELGPGRVVSKLVDQILGDRPHAAIALQVRGQCGVTRLLHALAELSAHGVEVDLDRLYEGRAITLLDLRALGSGPARSQPKHLWLVNGGEARPAGEPRRMLTPVARPATVPAPITAQKTVPTSLPARKEDDRGNTTTTNGFHTMTMNIASTASEDRIAPARVHEAFVTPRTAEGPRSRIPAEAAAYAEFQRTMRQFLKAQERVLGVYLGAGEAAISGPSRIEATAIAQVAATPRRPAALPVAAKAPRTAPTPAPAPAPARTKPVAPEPAEVKLPRQPEQKPVATASAPAPAPAEPATPPQATVDLESLLIEIVAERTGYPSEMLGLDANLEADLGIDSIKRVEIIGAFRRAALSDLGDPPSGFMEEMTAARTLRAILQGVARLLGGGGPPDPTQPEGGPERSEDTSDRSPRCVGTVVELPPPVASSAACQGVMVLTDEGRGIARALRREVEARGGRAEVIGPDDLATRDRTEAALGRIRAASGAIRTVVHLLPLREAPTFPGIDPEDWSRLADPELKGMLYLIQAMAPDLDAAGPGGPVTVAALSLGGGDFGETGELESAHPWRGGLAGLLKSAAKEWPQARFRAVDVDEIPDAAALLDEVSADGPVEVGYRFGRRLAIGAAREELPDVAPKDPAVALDDRSVILVTGGAQGITAEVARELAERTRATLVLLGRTPDPGASEDPETATIDDLTELRRVIFRRAKQANPAASARDVEAIVRDVVRARSIRGTLAAIRATGARAEYLGCDVRDAKALQAVVADVRRRFGGIDALIHGAGVIEDRRIIEKTAGSFDRVVGTKIDPMLTLTRVLDPDRLRLAMFFSSVAGFFGNEGQGDYAVGNEILNRMARRLANVWPGKVVAMNWGPWKGSGMVSPEVARQFAERGVGMVTVPGGRRAVWSEVLHSGGTDIRVVVGPGSWVGGESPTAETGSAPAPLLAGREVHRLPGGVLTAHLELDPDRHEFLDDHRIDGKPVLPLVVALELMAEFAALAEPGWHVAEVQDLRMLCGVTLDTPRRAIDLRAEPIERGARGGEWRVRIADPRLRSRPLYEAMIRLSAEPPVAPAAPALIPAAGAFPLSAPEAYRQWLFHGPTFQLIDAFRGIDSAGVDATLRRPAVSRAGWVVDPAVLDVAPQLALLWSRALDGTSALPSRIASYRRYATLGNGPCEVALRVHPETDGQIIKSDVWFLSRGRLLGEIRGLEGARSVELNRIGGGASR